MDKQLACATFATVIPVLMVAGYFSADIPNNPGRRLRIGLRIVASVILAAEVTMLFAVATVNPPMWEVRIGGYGALLATGGVATLFFIRLDLDTQAAADFGANPEIEQDVERRDGGQD